MSSSSAPRAVILLSGGLDSAVTLAIARRELGSENCHAISFDYGQRHHQELAAAQAVARQLGLAPARHITLPVGLTTIGGSALTDDHLVVPKDRTTHEVTHGIPITYVPARNLIFLSCAAGFAETVGARLLYIGVNAVDYSGYPDCREEFIRSFERTVNLGTKAGVERLEDGQGVALRIRTPLVQMSKPQIIRTGHDLGVDFSLTHSCYDPVVRAAAVLACGHCDSCIIRAKGFADAGIPDPTRYAEGSPRPDR